MKNIKPYIEKLLSLGIVPSVLKFKKEDGYKKLYKDPIKIKANNLHSTNFDNYDFLAIELEESGLICLDIEDHYRSVEEFWNFLMEKRINTPLLFIEKSLNDGLHVYFRTGGGIPKSHWNKLGNIHYDILTKRAFTSPSSFGNKSYEWVYNDFNSLESIDDIPKIPPSMAEFLENKEKYYEPLD